MTESRQQTNEVVHFSGVTARLAYIPPAEEEIIFQDDNRFTNGRWADGIDMIKVGPPSLYTNFRRQKMLVNK